MYNLLLITDNCVRFLVVINHETRSVYICVSDLRRYFKMQGEDREHRWLDNKYSLHNVNVLKTVVEQSAHFKSYSSHNRDKIRCLNLAFIKKRIKKTEWIINQIESICRRCIEKEEIKRIEEERIRDVMSIKTFVR